MTQYQLTLDSETMQRMFTGDSQLGRVLEAVLNQVLNAQVSEQRQGYRNGCKPRQITTRVGALLIEQDEVWTTGKRYFEMTAYWQWRESRLTQISLFPVTEEASMTPSA